ncbi:chromosome partition protein MukE [Shigella flexneri]
MIVREVACYLYLSPERLGKQEPSHRQELYDELLGIGRRSQTAEAGQQPLHGF